MDYKVIVVGAGHAGIEASLASARLGCPTLLVTFKKDTIGQMSCNPAIGGVGKGQLVKEIDALGGQMGRAADACGIQFRILNASKGQAVQSSRAQIDMELYKKYMQKIIEQQENLWVKEAQVEELIVKDNQVFGVVTQDKEKIEALCVILCPGTFLDGLIHIGLNHFSGGRINEPASIALADNLKKIGFRLLRFKTGTCPRLDKNTIDYSCLIEQRGDEVPQPFSFSTKKLTQRQIPCYITYTNEKTHKIILDNLDRSPLYTGIIKARGVRYCPSVEDKIVRFKDKTRHQVFLEPEGYDTDEVYPNGLSTSLPEDVQLKMLHSIKGLENVKVIRFGYGIEHTVVEPTQIYPTLETKLIKNLFLAGQINGTTGYEEAAAQGLVAGINAVLRVKGKEPLILDRSTSYIGVLIDDLTTKGTDEPYRMFTSRVEYRLLLRQDNADLRLREIGFNIGLVSQKDYQDTRLKQQNIEKARIFIKNAIVKPSPKINNFLINLNTSPLKSPVSLERLLMRPQITLEDLKEIARLSNLDGWDENLFNLPQIEIEIKYAGFIQRQLREVERFKHIEKIRIPPDLNYNIIPGLSREIKEKLNHFKPINLGQASRISGVTPAAVSILWIYLKKIDAYQKQ